MKIAFGLLLLVAGTAWADPGADVLSKVDNAMNNFTDGEFESKLFIREPGGAAREIDFTTFQKVPDKRLVRFSAPGDLKGMGVLVENKDVMYVFLPGFQKVRRVGTHVKAQTFMGSDFSYEDMSLSRYSPTYDAKLVKEDPSSWELALTVKAGQEIEYPKVHMWVDKKSNQPTKIDFEDAGGKVLKTSEYEGYHIDDANHYGPTKVVVTDHRRNDHKSEIVFTHVKLNQGLKDDFFTQRTLIRGH
ncbi:MAG TPA: outer membrane lipoprotein-sorting protein [Polyangia bacterium]|nr:outer membrane lipoprotein-sorting protein [Polyangia bacterium]